jgi:hypothetical protein
MRLDITGDYADVSLFLRALAASPAYETAARIDPPCPDRCAAGDEFEHVHRSVQLEPTAAPCPQHQAHPHGGLVCARCRTCWVIQPSSRYATHDDSDLWPEPATRDAGEAV